MPADAYSPADAPDDDAAPTTSRRPHVLLAVNGYAFGGHLRNVQVTYPNDPTGDVLVTTTLIVTRKDVGEVYTALRGCEE